jgi:hypothetical protein
MPHQIFFFFFPPPYLISASSRHLPSPSHFRPPVRGLILVVLAWERLDPGQSARIWPGKGRISTSLPRSGREMTRSRPVGKGPYPSQLAKIWPFWARKDWILGCSGRERARSRPVGRHSPSPFISIFICRPEEKRKRMRERESFHFKKEKEKIYDTLICKKMGVRVWT